MGYSGFKIASQSKSATNVINKYRAVKVFSEEQRREIYDVLKNEDYLCISGEKGDNQYVKKKEVSRAFLKILFNLDNLISLDLSNTGLFSLPENLEKLTNLQALILSNTSINTLLRIYY